MKQKSKHYKFILIVLGVVVLLLSAIVFQLFMIMESEQQARKNHEHLALSVDLLENRFDEYVNEQETKENVQALKERQQEIYKEETEKARARSIITPTSFKNNFLGISFSFPEAFSVTQVTSNSVTVEHATAVEEPSISLSFIGEGGFGLELTDIFYELSMNNERQVIIDKRSESVDGVGGDDNIITISGIVDLSDNGTNQVIIHMVYAENGQNWEQVYEQVISSIEFN